MPRTKFAVATVSLCTAFAALAMYTSTTNAQPAGGPPNGQPDIGAMLAKGLNEVEGCHKVSFAQTSDGLNTIMAWFEDKAAAMEWYHSETHTRVMRMTGSDPNAREAMAEVPDGVPVFVMASIKMSRDGSSVLPGPMPVSQISIELYTPLDAGASVGGRLMPDEIELPHFRKLDAVQGE